MSLPVNNVMIQVLRLRLGRLSRLNSTSIEGF